MSGTPGEIPDDQLMQLLQQQGQPTLPSGASALSDEELQKLLGQTAEVAKGVPQPGEDDLHRIKLFGQSIPKGAAHVLNLGNRLIKEVATRPSPETTGALMMADPDKAMEVQAILAQANKTGTENVNAIDRRIEQMGEQPIPGTADKYIGAAGQGIGGALIPLPGGAPAQGIKSVVGAVLRNAGIGGTAGVAAEGANELAQGVTGDRENTKTRLAAGILTALGVSGGLNLVSKQAGTANQLAAELLDGMSDAELAAAARAFDDHGVQGLQPILSQVANNPRLSAMAEILSEQGPKTRGVLERQPGQIKSELDANMRALDPAATRTTEQQASNAMQDLFTARKKAATDARTAAYKAEIAQVGGRAVSMREISQVAHNIRESARSMGSSAESSALIRIADRLESDAPNWAMGSGSARLNDLITNLKGYADEVGVATGQTVKGNIKAGAKGKSAGIIAQEIDRLSPPAYKRADARYARDTARINEVFNKSVAGRLIGKGARDDTEAANRLYKIFDAGTTPGATSEIRALGRMASKTPQGQKDFHDAYVGYLSKRIADAVGDNPAPKDVDDAIAAILGKTEGGGAASKVQGLKDAMSIMATNKGLPPDELYKGFINFLETSRSLVKRQPIRGHGGALQSITEKASSTPAATALRFQYLGNLAKRMERMYSKNAFAEVDELFSSKEGLATLQQMARAAPGSPKAQALLRAYLAAEATNDGQSE